MTRTYDLPGFSRYKVQAHPFRVIDTKRDCEIKPLRRKRGAPTVKLVDDNGVRRQWSTWTIAALAYHGQPPNNTIAHCYSDEITPQSIRWVDRAVAASYRRRAFTLSERDRVLRLYYENGLTQDAIAARFGVTQATVSRAIAKGGREV